METASQHSQKLLLLVEMTGDRKTGLSLFRYRLVDNNKESKLATGKKFI